MLKCQTDCRLIDLFFVFCKHCSTFLYDGTFGVSSRSVRYTVLMASLKVQRPGY